MGENDITEILLLRACMQADEWMSEDLQSACGTDTDKRAGHDFSDGKSKLTHGSQLIDMGREMRVLLLLSLLAPCQAGVIVKRYAYELKDNSRNVNYPEGTVEHHCILFAEDNSPISVVGTYG
eukprot:388246-Hanusia_phi.AAC.1